MPQLGESLNGLPIRRQPVCVRGSMTPKATTDTAAQPVLPWGGGPELTLLLQWQQVAESFRRANGARASDWEARLML